VPNGPDPPFLGVELAELLLKNELRGWSWVFAAPQLHSTLKDPLPFKILMYLHRNAIELPLNSSSSHPLSPLPSSPARFGGNRRRACGLAAARGLGGGVRGRQRGGWPTVRGLGGDAGAGRRAAAQGLAGSARPGGGAGAGRRRAGSAAARGLGGLPRWPSELAKLKKPLGRRPDFARPRRRRLPRQLATRPRAHRLGPLPRATLRTSQVRGTSPSPARPSAGRAARHLLQGGSSPRLLSPR